MLKNNQNDFSKARESAAGLIKRFVFSFPEEIVVEDIAMARGVLVVEGKLEGSEARLVRKQNKGIIRVRSDIPEGGRKRFAIAHEIGHWELHEQISQLYLCSAADLRNYNGSNPEIEANVFAGELLMPTALFRPMCRKVEPGLEGIIELAKKFGTSITSTAVRFIEEHKEKCIIVLSENAKTLWWRSKEYFPGIWIESNQKVHGDSAAWECFYDGVTFTKMQEVPPEAWFQNLRNRKNMEVYEQSMKLGGYAVVLTLLWIMED